MNCTEKRNVGDKRTCWHLVVKFLLLTSQLQIVSCSSHMKIDDDSSSLLFVNVGENTNFIIPIPKHLQDIAECHLIQVFRMKDNPHPDLTRIRCSLPRVNITNKCLCNVTTFATSTLYVRINNIEFKDGGRWLVNVSTSTEQKSFNFYLDVMAGMQVIDRFLPVFALVVSVWLFLFVAFIPLFAFNYSRLRSPKTGLSKIEDKSADVVVQLEPSAACQNEEKVSSSDKDSGDKPMVNLFRQESNMGIVFVMPEPASPCPTRLAFPLDREILGSPRLQLHSEKVSSSDKDSGDKPMVNLFRQESNMGIVFVKPEPASPCPTRLAFPLDREILGSPRLQLHSETHLGKGCTPHKMRLIIFIQFLLKSNMLTSFQENDTGITFSA